MMFTCPVCRKPFESPERDAKHCSIRCAHVPLRKLDVEKLRLMVAQGEFKTRMAKELGVSHSLVRQTIRKLGLQDAWKAAGRFA